MSQYLPCWLSWKVPHLGDKRMRRKTTTANTMENTAWKVVARMMKATAIIRIGTITKSRYAIAPSSAGPEKQ